LIYYDWLVDSATTSHITHQWDVFITYTCNERIHDRHRW
jgi:hypothetical protein